MVKSPNAIDWWFSVPALRCNLPGKADELRGAESLNFGKQARVNATVEELRAGQTWIRQIQ
jgi:hypothetical protein